MDSEKMSYQFESGAVFAKVDGKLQTATVPPPVVKLTVSRPKASPSSPLYIIGVFACAFLLFHLYLTTTFHHAALDQELHRLEEELLTIHQLQLVHSNATAAGLVNSITQDTNKDEAVPGTQRLPYGGLDELPSDSHRMRKKHRGKRRSNGKSDPAVAKRGGGATFTWFHPGRGACGGFNGDNDFIVAISHLIWNGGAHCGDTISITYNGKVVQATVADECMGCDPNHIDLSPGLLRHLVGPGRDMVSDGVWSFGGLPKVEEKPKPKPTTSRRPQTTSTKELPTTTTHTSTQVSSTSTQAPSSATSTSAFPTATPESYGSMENIEAFTDLFINLGGIAMAGVLAEDN